MELPVKPRLASIVIYIISFISNLILFSRIIIQKRKLVPTQEQKETSMHTCISMIERNTLGDITICIFGFILLAGYTSVVVAFNNLEPSELNHYPNYLLAYCFHHYVPCLGFAAFWSLLYVWKLPFQDFLKRTLKSYIIRYTICCQPHP